jgi:predicted  nucleic acid-binding Zn-ribbon protein
MSESEETLNQKDTAVLKAIADLARNLDERFNGLEAANSELKNQLGNLENRFDKFEKQSNVQFEAIREGIVYNNVRFERLTAEIYEARADISKLRANVTELTEEIRQNKKSLV